MQRGKMTGMKNEVAERNFHFCHICGEGENIYTIFSALNIRRFLEH
jgi:hypothetical protein